MTATPDGKVAALTLKLLHERDEGWRRGYPAPSEHLRDCPDVEVVEVETHGELWFDTGVDAVRLTARIRCPHEGPVDWEWADLGELAWLIEELDP